MACTACQNVTTQSWEFWSRLCDQVYDAQYPQPIPLKTAIPHWAILGYNVCAQCRWRGTKSSISDSAGSQANDTFNSVTARSAGGQPEVLALLPSTITLPTSSTGSTNPTSTSSSQNNGDEPKASLNMGAIVGIVVGGLAVLAAIGVWVWVFLRRRAAARVVEDYPDYPKYSAAAYNSEHRMGPPQMRLYVSSFRSRV